ncbi:MAG TPA: transcription antitermination factor NusB, partial [Kofleriaceae bacterium]|nr:transcription antitermination factor NusB [Kofleriaceae bacterium]
MTDGEGGGAGRGGVQGRGAGQGRRGGPARGRGAEVTARDVARRVLDRVEKGAWATLALDGELTRSGLEDRDRRLASELIYGVLRNRLRIDRALAAHAELKRTPPRVVTALRIAVYQLLFLDRVPGYAAVDDAVHAARAVGGPKLAGFCNAVLRKLTTSGEPALPAPSRERIEVEHSLPRWIADELAAASTERFEHVAAALARPAPLVARANRLRTTREGLMERFRAEGVTVSPVAGGETGAEMALALEGLGDPAKSGTFNAGLWTVQDTGAQIVGAMASPSAGQRILDACAGVGGKSTHLAELSDDASPIDAADQLKTKLHLAEATARRLGITSVKPQLCDLLDPAAPLSSAYDLIVLDAPCSGLGVLRRHPDAKWRLKPDDVPRLAALQRQLLDAVVPRLA